MEQVDLVNDHQPHQLRVRALACFAGDDVPLLGRHHNHVGGFDLGTGQADVARQLSYLHAVRLQPRLEAGHLLRYESLFGGWEIWGEASGRLKGALEAQIWNGYAFCNEGAPVRGGLSKSTE